MSTCREIRPWLEWLAAGEIDEPRRRLVEVHVRECASCRLELDHWRSLLEAAARPAAAAAAEAQTIDWNAVRGTILAGVRQRRALERPSRTGFPAVYLAAAAVAAVMVGLGIFFLARPRAQGIAPLGRNEITSASMSQLQARLAREEAVTYLQQSQLMLTGLLKNCASEEMEPWEMRLASLQARKLLLKKKFFQPHLSELEWSKVRQVSERIDWLSYEILQLEERQACDQVARLQGIMERERLLLKIRLVESEFAWQVPREV